MFHLIHGTLLQHDTEYYITNDYLGIQVMYNLKEKPSMKPQTYFVHPYLDDNNKTVKYYAFDTSQEKSFFEQLLKISGIGPKSAFALVQLGQEKLAHAIDAFDISIIQGVPGIGPKTAKKILIELKGSFSDRDLVKINADERLIRNITTSLTTMGYDKRKVLSTLQRYQEPITQEQLSIILPWIIQHIDE